MITRRRKLILLGVFLGVPGLLCSGLIGTAALILGTERGSDWLIERAAGAVNALLPGARLEIDRVESNLVSTFRIEGVRIIAQDGHEFVAFDELYLRWYLPDLLTGRARLTQARLLRPRAAIAPLPDGRLDLMVALGLDGEKEKDKAPSEPFSGLPLDLVIDRLEVIDGAFEWGAGDQAWKVQDLDLLLALSVTGRNVRCEDLALGARFAQGEKTPLPLSLKGALGLREGDLVVDHLGVLVATAALNLQGSIRAVETEPDFLLGLKLALSEPLALEPLIGNPGLAGPLGLDLNLQGPLTALVGKGGIETPSGSAALQAWANLKDTPPRWSLDLGLNQLQLEGTLPALFDQASTLLDGSAHLQGQGFDWPKGIQGEGSFLLNQGLIWAQPFNRAEGSLKLENGELRIENLLLDAPIGLIATQGSFDLSAKTLGLDLDLRSVALAELSAFGVRDLGGRADFKGRFSLAAAGAMEISGQADLRDASYGDFFHARSASGPVLVNLHKGQVSVRGELQASGFESYGARLGTLSGPYEVTVDDSGVGWRADVRASSVDYSGVLADSLSARVEGGYRDEVLSLDVGYESPSLTIPGLPTSRAEGWVQMRGAKLELDARTFEGERPVLEAALAFDTDTGQTTFSRVFVSPNPNVAWENAEPVRLSVSSTGIEDIDILLKEADTSEGERASGRMHLSGRLGSKGELDLVMKAGDITLDPLATLLPGLPADLKGQTRLDLHLHGTMDRLAFEGSGSVRGFSYPGSIRRLDADLNLRSEGDRVDFDLLIPVVEDTTPKKPGRGGQKLVDPFPVAWLARGQGSVPLRLSSKGPLLDPDSALNLKLTLSAGELARWRQVLQVQDLPDGRLSAELELSGTARALRSSLLGALDIGVGEGSERVRLDLDLRQEADRLLLDATMTEGMARQVSLTGTARSGLSEYVRTWALSASPDPSGPIAPADPARLATWVDDLDINIVPTGLDLAFVRGAAGLPANLEGRVTGGINVSGPIRSPLATGGLQIEDAKLGGMEVAPALLMVTPGEGGYDVALNLGMGAQGSVEVNGHLPLSVDLETGLSSEGILAAQGLDMRIGGAGIPLETLAAISPAFAEAGGQMLLSGQVSGSLGSPRVDELHVSLSPGSSIGIKSLGVKYQDMELKASLTGLGACRTQDAAPCTGQLQLDTLRARTVPLGSVSTLGSGTLALSGSVGFEGWTPTQVKFKGEAEKLRLINTPRYGFVTTGKLAINGTYPAIRVGGRFEVDDARLLMDQAAFLSSGTLDLDESIHLRRSNTLANEAPAAPVAPVDPWYKDVRVDLDLDLARNTWVTTRMPLDDRFGSVYASLATFELSAQLEGKVKATWAEQELGVKGEVSTVRGTARILGADFEVEEGNIAFVGADPSDPILDVKATHHQSQWGDVNVAISGGQENLEVRFSSDTYPDETDIVSILVLGRPLSELSREEGQSNAGLLAVASAAVMGELERSLGGAVFDLFEVETSDTGGVGAVRMGQSLGDRVFIVLSVKAEADPGENLTEATVDWNLGRSWTVQVVTGDQGASSADIFHLWRF